MSRFRRAASTAQSTRRPRNLKNIAVRDGDPEWFEEQMAGAHSRKALLNKYHDKVGDMEKNRKAGARNVLPRALDLKESLSNNKEIGPLETIIKQDLLKTVSLLRDPTGPCQDPNSTRTKLPEQTLPMLTS